MTTYQEPKYKIEGDNIVNRQSGVAIPDGEPIFIFRAKDRHLVKVLEYYRLLVMAKDWEDAYIVDEHPKAIEYRIDQIRMWQSNNTLKIKDPDTELDGGWEPTGY